MTVQRIFGGGTVAAAGFGVEKHGGDQGLHIAALAGAERDSVGGESAIGKGVGDPRHIRRTGIAGDQVADEPLGHKRRQVGMIEDDVQGGVEVLLRSLIGGKGRCPE